MREAIGGGEAVIASNVKVGAAGASIGISTHAIGGL
jgi:hypothetical protein